METGNWKLGQLVISMNFDISLFKTIHGLVGRSICLDSLGIFIAVYLIWFIPILIFLIWFLNRKKKSSLKALFLGLLAVILVYLFDFLIEKIFFRPRPFVSLNFYPLINISPQESSFPSTHAALAFALASSVYFINRRLGVIFLVLTLLIGISRIFIGVHWPSDILAGAVLGLGCSWMIYKLLLDKLKPITNN